MRPRVASAHRRLAATRPVACSTDWSVSRRGGDVDLRDTAEQAAYREQVRAWLDEHGAEAPPASGRNDDTAYIDARRRWQGRLAEAGPAGGAGARGDGGGGGGGGG